MTLFTLAGCFGGPGPIQNDDTEADDREDGPTGTLTLFEGCTDYGTYKEYLQGQNPAPPVDEWPESSRPSSDILYIIHECDRISWGPFVRGPVRFVAESHTAFLPSDPCWPGNGSTLTYMTYIGFDDPEVAEYAATHFGMPAHPITITPDENTMAVGKQVTWQWGTNGTFSELTFVEQELTQREDFDNNRRFFWRFEDFPAAWDLHFEGEVRLAAASVAHGMIEEPMIVGSTEDNRITNVAGIGLDSKVSGSITFFQDWECTPASTDEDRGNETASKDGIARSLDDGRSSPLTGGMWLTW